MSEVGVLQLKIQDNSSKAAGGLDALAGALERVRNAVKGDSLLTTASGISKVMEAVKTEIDKTALSNFTKLCNNIEKLNSMGKVKINVAVTGADKARVDIKNTMKAAEEAYGYGSMKKQLEQRIGKASAVASSAMGSPGRMKLNLQQFGGRGGGGVSESVRELIDDNASRLDLLIAKADILREKLGKGVSSGKMNNETAVNTALQISRVEGQIEAARSAAEGETNLNGAVEEATAVQRAISSLMETLNKPLRYNGLDQFINRSQGIGRTMLSAKESAEVFTQGVSGSSSQMLNASRSAEEYSRKLVDVKKQISSLMNHLNKPTNYRGLSEVVNQTTGVSRAMSSAEESARGFRENTTEMGRNIERFIDRLESPISYKGLSQYIDSMQGIGRKSGRSADYQNVLNDLFGAVEESGSADAARDVESSIAEAASETTEVAAGMRDVESTVAEAAESTNTMHTYMNMVKSAIKQVGDHAKSLKKSFSSMFPTISNLFSSVLRIAKTRLIRSMIKEITSGVKTGIENAYRYSQKIGSSFSSSMDAAASSLLQMKNSIGAALMPLLETLIPYLQTAVNWFIELVNYANQFIALMRGQSTWTKATTTSAKAFDDVKNSAKGAGSAIKDLLADWDELNIIQSESSSTGSTTGTKAMTDYLSMFEDVNTFSNEIKSVVNWIQEHMDDIKTTAILIGSAILGWKLSTAFAEMIPFLSTLGTGILAGATIGITLKLTDLTGNAFIDTGKPEWLLANALTGAVGSEIAAELATKIAGKEAGQVVRGFTLLLSGIVNLENGRSAMVQNAYGIGFALSALGSLESGIGTALIAKGFKLSTAFSFALGASVAAGTIAIALGAAIQLSKDEVDWGTISLTKEEVETYVTTNMFTGIDVTATISVIDATIEKVSVSRQALRTRLQNMLPTIYALKIGVDKKASYEQLKEQIFGNEENGTEGLISQIQTYATDNVQELKQAFAIVPSIDKTGTDVSAKLIESGITGWGEVSAYARKLGDDLGKELSKGFTEDGLANFDENAVQEMTKKLVKISEIITGSQTEASALTSLKMSLSDIMMGDLDQEAVNQTIQVYDEYLRTLTEKETQIYTEAATQFLTLSKYYEEMGNTDKAKEYMDQYLEAIENMPDSVKAAVQRASGSGMDMIYEMLRDKFGDVFERVGKNLEGENTGMIRQLLLANFTPTDGDVEKTAADFNSALANIFGNENVYLKGLLTQMPGLNMWGALTDEMKQNMVPILSELYGPEVAESIIKQLSPVIQEGADDTGKEATEAVKEAVQESMPKTVPVDGAQMEVEIENPNIKLVESEIKSGVKDGFERAITEAVEEVDVPENSDAISGIESEITAWLGKALAQGYSPYEILGYLQEYVNSAQIDYDAVTEILEKYNVPEKLTEEWKKYGDQLSMPGIDSSALQTGANEAATAVEGMATRIRGALNGLNGITYSLDMFGQTSRGSLTFTFPAIANAYDGGIFTSGQIFTANENGRAEMIGEFGGKTAVANNDQIVAGISSGVSQANSGIESRLSTIETLMNRILNKEFTARAVPSSGWGQHGARSADQYSKVTGVY